MAYSWPTKDEACEKLDKMDVPAGTNVKRDHSDGSWYFADMEGNALADPADAPADADDEKIAPMREAQEGDVVVQFGGPGLPALVREQALKALAAVGKKYGLDYAVFRNALDMSVIETVSRADVKGMKGSKSPRSMTEKNTLALELLTRTMGATEAELKDSGASNAGSLSVVYLCDTLTVATKGRYAVSGFDWRTHDQTTGSPLPKPHKAHIMRELPEAEWEANLAATRARMAAKSQNGKKRSANDDAKVSAAAD